MRVDPSLERKPGEGCWVVFGPFPISRDGNVQLHESLGQHHIAGQMLAEFSIEFLGRAGIGKRGG